MKHHNGNHNNHHRHGRSRYDRAGIYRWIVRYKIAHDGNSPTFRQIMRAFDMPSLCTVHRQIDELVRLGFIKHERGDKRGIEVVGGGWMSPELAREQDAERKVVEAAQMASAKTRRDMMRVLDSEGWQVICEYINAIDFALLQYAAKGAK